MNSRPSDNVSGPRRLAFYATPEHPCSYLPARTARTLFADPAVRLDNRIYSRLTLYGFRRSGRHIYRPSCDACEACVPVRIPVRDFAPNRSQRRTWARNQDLSLGACTPGYHQEHFELYRRYVAARHPGGGMDNADPMQYLDFLTSSWSDTWFQEFRAEGRLVAVAVTDRLEHGLSAVYTFFEPDLRPRGLGTYAILWQIEECKRQGLECLYLGYWIGESPKMAYKASFWPLEQFRQGRWHRCGEHLGSNRNDISSR